MREFPKHITDRVSGIAFMCLMLRATKKNRRIWDLEYALDCEKWYHEKAIEDFITIKEEIQKESEMDREKYKFLRKLFDDNNIFQSKIIEARTFVDDFDSCCMVDREIIKIPASGFYINYGYKDPALDYLRKAINNKGN